MIEGHGKGKHDSQKFPLGLHRCEFPDNDGEVLMGLMVTFKADQSKKERKKER